MKNLLIICFVFISSILLCSFTFSGVSPNQFSDTEMIGAAYGSEFSKGFKDGWCEGWKDVKGSLSMCPMAPMAPMPKLGQSRDSYRDGYNTGFKAGMRKANSSRY